MGRTLISWLPVAKDHFCTPVVASNAYIVAFTPSSFPWPTTMTVCLPRPTVQPSVELWSAYLVSHFTAPVA